MGSWILGTVGRTSYDSYAAIRIILQIRGQKQFKVLS